MSLSGVVTSSLSCEITVSDLKQIAYCQRVVYYHYVQPLPSHPTYKMQFGQQAHERASVLENRRTLEEFNLSGVEGKRYFHVHVYSALGYRGFLDMVIDTEKELVPVEMKLTPKEWRENHIDQLVAYAMALEETWGKTVQHGFLMALPSRKLMKVGITPIRRQRVADHIRNIRTMIQAETLPPPTPHRGRCRVCEFRLFCADVPV